MIRGALSAIARNEQLGGALSRAPIARDVVKRIVGGESVVDAVAVASELADRGFFVSLERAAPPSTTAAQADDVADEYQALIDAVSVSGLGGVCEIAVVPEAVGLDEDAPDAAARLAAIVAHAHAQGLASMIGLAGATDVPATIALSGSLAAEGLPVGVTLPAVLRSTEAECATHADSRVRLVKGGLRPSSPLGYAQPIEIDKAYVRCVKTLLRGSGEPSFATHDTRIIEIIESLTARFEREQQSYEFSFFMGRMESVQERLRDQGERVRVYVPYGPQWFERLVGGLAEQPSSVAAAMRSIVMGR